MRVQCQEKFRRFLGGQEQPASREPALRKATGESRGGLRTLAQGFRRGRRGVTRMALGALVGQGGKGGSIKIHFRPFVYLIEKLVPNGGKKCATGDCF